MLPEPSFLTIDAEAEFAALIEQYEVNTGRQIQPTQPEYLLLRAIAYRFSLLKMQLNAGAKQGLAAFATAPILDYLGQIVGVQRLPATRSVTVLRYQLLSGHTGVIIPAGHRIQSRDGKVWFAPVVDTIVPSGTNQVDIDATCNVDGQDGNGYLAGLVDTVMDPLPFIVSAANLTTTAGGAVQETDEQLRTRIQLAPGQFSTAGSRASYEFWARTAHPSIIDVGVASLNAGEVTLYPLTDLADETPQAILDAVQAAASAEDRRPITDTVNVESPTAVTYSVNAQLTVFASAVPQATIATVTTALTALTAAKARKLGQDVTLDMLTAACMIEGVYGVEFPGLSADVVVNASQFAKCIGITVQIAGTTNG